MKTLLATALLLIAPVVAAHEATPRLEVTQLKTLYSVQGESKEAFVKRIAPEFTSFTRQSGFEACGVLATNGEGYSVVVQTVGAQIACGTARDAYAAGYTSLKVTIHSHPEATEFKLNAADNMMRGNVWNKVSTERSNNCAFSNEDYRQEGYLFACGKVMYQNGRGTATEL